MKLYCNAVNFGEKKLAEKYIYITTFLGLPIPIYWRGVCNKVSATGSLL